MLDFSIDDEFRARIFAMSNEERVQLEANLLTEGCRDSLVVWEEGRLLIDGHNRYAICTAHDIAYSVESVSLPSREAALDWIDRNQLARRNLSPADYKIISGRMYNRRKQQQGGDRKSKAQVELLNAADAIAEELGTSRETIKRNAQRAALHDALLEDGEEEAAEIVKVIPQAEVAKAVRIAKEDPQAAVDAVKRVHVSNNSGDMEWYTPPIYLAAARKVLGSIDIDPASCDIAQGNVEAEKFFTIDDDGLSHEWHGNVWLNPPYSKGMVDKFADKMLQEFHAARVEAAIVLVNNSTDTAWFALLASAASAICFPKGRIKFLDATNQPANSPLQGQAFLYFGDRDAKFVEVFAQFGSVWRA